MLHRVLSILIVLSSLGIGILYISLHEPMPYHQLFLQTEFSSLPGNSKEFIMGLIHLLGCCFVLFGMLLLFQLRTVNSDGGKTYCGSLLAGTLLLLLPLQYFTLRVGNGSPWWLITLLIFACSINLIILKLQALSGE